MRFRLPEAVTKAQTGAARLPAAVALVVLILVVALGFAGWRAAQAHLYAQRLADTEIAQTAIVKNMRRLFSHTQTVDISGQADMKLAADAGSTLYIESGVFPAAMIAPGRRGVRSAFGGAVAVTQAAVSEKGDGFAVYFDALPPHACADMLVIATQENRDPLLSAAGTGPTGLMPATPIETFPIAPATAASLCGAQANAVGFVYKLHQGAPEAAPRPTAHKEKPTPKKTGKAPEKKPAAGKKAAREKKVAEKKPAHVVASAGPAKATHAAPKPQQHPAKPAATH